MVKEVCTFLYISSYIYYFDIVFIWLYFFDFKNAFLSMVIEISGMCL